MQPCNRDMQAMNSMMNQSQMSLPDLQNGQHHHHHQQIATPQIHHFDTASSHDDFLHQMLSSLPSCSWPDLADANPKSPWDLSSNPEAAEAGIGSNMSQEVVVVSDDHGPSNPENVSQHQFHFEHDQPPVLASKLRQYQISGGVNSEAAVKALLLQQQLQLQSTVFGGGGLHSPTGASGAGESGMLHGNGDDVVDASSFKSPNSGIDGSVQALYNGFAGSLHGNDQIASQGQHFHHPQAQNFGAAVTGEMNQAPAASGSAGGGVTAQPKQQRVRARRGQATDPHSIAERLRRERIAERMKALQELVPNANKTDKASMLDEIIDYVKFLQLQVKVLSMSRLGGAAAVAPLVADMSSEGGGDCIQASVGGARNGNGTAAAASTSNNNDNPTVTEHQVAKLMEEDMGSAMQYLQGKGLCLMPISLATAISTAASQSRSPIAANPNPLLAANGADGGPSSPSLSVLTVQSGAVGNGGADISGKDAVSISDP